MKNKINSIEKEFPPYQALRSVAYIIVTLGWLFILLGVVVTLAVYDLYLSPALNTYLPKDYDPTLANIISVGILFFQWLIIFIFGMFIVAAGQIYLVLLDIRDATYAQKEYTRLMLKNQVISS